MNVFLSKNLTAILCIFRSITVHVYFYSPKLNRYTKVRDIGKGSYGVVSLMKDTHDHNKYVVVKTIKTKRNNTEEMKKAQQEAELLKSLQHPNVIQYYDSFFKSPTELCIVLEYADGKDLSKYLQSHPKLTESKILEIFTQIIFGIAYIHSQNILHRDIKIANILYFKSGFVKIGDFGISREVSEDSLATTIIGTPYFMAPEIISQQPYSYPADIWAAGCILFELMTGEHAFNGKSRDELFSNIKYGKTPKLPKRFSKGITDLLLKMISKNPARRPTAQEILKMPIIQRELSRLEYKMKADISAQQSFLSNQTNQSYVSVFSSPKSQSKLPVRRQSNIKNEHINNTNNDDDEIDQYDVPDWIKDNKVVAAELIRQSFQKLQGDRSRFADIIHASISQLPKNNEGSFHAIQTDLPARKSLLETQCKEILGDKYDVAYNFIKNNWVDDQSELKTILGVKHLPEDAIKMLETITMIERFQNPQ
ncbi:CAMK family protein kinase [Tritrichomonas foetus]|uniref:non-specific serine/threonine protein kinase n=1 Tax=Tritrichomonas foetus TaxID=1144522 RepID=A0A1J4L1I5_9EUKA|nr:CAMK family protein kinase [Tritrichomonas foetus]|eukprot:OHT15828.1 CAMK family protein kinase [Tritrichomonas foetus]